MAKENKKNGGNKKIGRDKAKCEQYRRRQQHEKRAMRHMLKSNNYKDVVAYAVAHNMKAPPRPTRRENPRSPHWSPYVEE